MIGISDAAANEVFVFKFKESMRIQAKFKRLSKISLGGPKTEGRELDCSPDVNCWRLCVGFSGAQVPNYVQFHITSELDANIGRIKCKHRGTECKDRRIETQLRVKKNEEKCTRPIPLVYDSSHENKIDPVPILTKVAPIPPGNLEYIVDPYSTTELVETLSIWKECKSRNNTCQSELTAPFGEIDPDFIIYSSPGIRGGQNGQFKLKIMFTVEKDPSFNTKLFIYHPKEARYANLKVLRDETGNRNKNRNSGAQANPVCIKDESEPLLYVCMLGNPLNKGHHTLYVYWYIEPTGQSAEEHFYWHINNTNDGEPSTTGVQTVTLGVEIETDETILITAENDQIPYREGLDWLIQHNYTVRNRGLVNVRTAKVLIQWPEYTNTNQRHRLLAFKNAYTNSKHVTVNCSHCKDCNDGSGAAEDMVSDRLNSAPRDKSGLIDYVSLT